MDSVLVQFVVAFLPMIPVIVILVRNQAEAQRIINERFVKMQDSLDQERKERYEQGVAAAKREGGLNQQIEDLKRQLDRANEERRIDKESDASRSQENARNIARLEITIENLVKEQKTMLEQRDTAIKERDGAVELIKSKDNQIEQSRHEKEAAMAAQREGERRESLLLQEREQLLTLVEDREKTIARLTDILEGKITSSGATSNDVLNDEEPKEQSP
jgi:hypothetical protein